MPTLGLSEGHSCAASAQHAAFLRTVGDAVGAFLSDVWLQGVGDDVTTLVWTELGWRVRQNESVGTGHRTAGPLFLLVELPLIAQRGSRTFRLQRQHVLVHWEAAGRR
jgi:hypothetical protein